MITIFFGFHTGCILPVFVVRYASFLPYLHNIQNISKWGRQNPVLPLKPPSQMTQTLSWHSGAGKMPAWTHSSNTAMSAAVSSGLLPTTHCAFVNAMPLSEERHTSKSCQACMFSAAQQSWQLKGDKSLGDKIS